MVVNAVAKKKFVAKMQYDEKPPKLDFIIFDEIGRQAAVLIFSGWFPFPLLGAILLFRYVFL